jgi:4-diphosphocytidyl-2-C-methyl-D-erythritol kinase
VRVNAFAKINLSLRVLGVRPDGYHELRTVFQSLALHDTLTISRQHGAFRIECDDPTCPADSTNLIWRAASAAWKASGRRGAPRDIVVTLNKRIPMAAGLGGGSSDAAAALRALSKAWRVDPARLPELAKSLGADVPYFLEGGTVLGLERGDLLFPLVDRPSSWVTVVIPSFGIITKEAFGWFDADRPSHSGAEAPPSTTSRLQGPSRLVQGPKLGPYNESVNDLQAPVTRRHPEIGRIVSALRAAGASHAAMSGSGSAVFGLFDRRTGAVRAASAVGTSARRTVVTRTLARAEYRRLAAK